MSRRLARGLPPERSQRPPEASVLAGLRDDDSAQGTAALRRLVGEAVNAERERLTRDLHDGVQQRLVHTVLVLELARRALRNGDSSVEALVSEALEHAQTANTELRELARGTLPSDLTQSGLRAGVEALASRVPLPVTLDVSVGRLAPTIEAHVYFIVAEALTNVIKHSRAGAAAVHVAVSGDVLRLEVRDDGIGGARLESSSGLRGLADRVRSLHGTLRLHSPPGRGTLIAAHLPLTCSSRPPAPV
jgi:signal transduction histidine kinase